MFNLATVDVIIAISDEFTDAVLAMRDKDKSKFMQILCILSKLSFFRRRRICCLFLSSPSYKSRLYNDFLWDII